MSLLYNRTSLPGNLKYYFLNALATAESGDTWHLTLTTSMVTSHIHHLELGCLYHEAVRGVMGTVVIIMERLLLDARFLSL